VIEEVAYKLAADRLRYDELSGKLYWTVSIPRQRISAGQEAARKKKRDGYMRVTVNRRTMAVHRLAWFIVHGRLPRWIDHINGVRDDNRLCNLRECTPSQNQWNKGPEKRNKTGLKGVGIAESGRFRAYIRCWSKTYGLGTFDSAEQAHAAYVEAASLLHGEFARFR
jgi:hypothetical protein